MDSALQLPIRALSSSPGCPGPFICFVGTRVWQVFRAMVAFGDLVPYQAPTTGAFCNKKKEKNRWIELCSSQYGRCSRRPVARGSLYAS